MFWGFDSSFLLLWLGLLAGWVCSCKVVTPPSPISDLRSRLGDGDEGAPIGDGGLDLRSDLHSDPISDVLVATEPAGNNGRLLGLTTQDEALNSANNHFVALEFDIWSDYEFDPIGEHVVRYKIVQDLASALHEGWEQCLLHRDIKSSNIMLDSNFNAKLGDFGLARLVDHDKASQITNLAGTKGYIDPGCVTTRRASKKSNVYSFGIVALELAYGRKPIDHKATKGQIVMLDWVKVLYERGEVHSAIDKRLCGCFDEQQMKCLLIVGLWCAHSERDRRPSIREAIQVLNFEAS
ncbi:hypothetical protein SO802_028042 [Lithocarpus litseifolius]|uniref:Protein kinase domain-containing protein n=1 Tax=Lithocarpus litseifolius TaxID=425828 RepID=A0AAW2BQ76_9ROSI